MAGSEPATHRTSRRPTATATGARTTAVECTCVELMDENDSSWYLPTDALVEIMVRLPPNARRRLRLVCRIWLELIDQRTMTDMWSRTKIIAVTGKGFACVVDVLTPGSAINLWQRWRTTDIATALRYGNMSIVGTCNGLVCLCDDLTPGGAITVANPSTCEALCLPPLPPMPSGTLRLNNNSNRRWHQTYNFAYHLMTGRYKVVHVPRHFDRFSQPDIVPVFTLGEASWRDVQTGTDARCSLGSNSLANVDGTVYWLMEEAGKIMSFDLKHERAARTKPLPVLAMPGTCRLMKVHGRLGVAVRDNDTMMVWFLEGERWSRRYALEARKLRLQDKWMRRELVVSHFVHGDYFVMSTPRSSGVHFVLPRYTVSEAARSQDGVVNIRHEDGHKVVCFVHSIYQTFVYIETKEPLSVYNAVLVHK